MSSSLPPRLIVNGRGFGHGVGMSQWGAQGMARAGDSFDKILTHYYPGIAVERADEATVLTGTTQAAPPALSPQSAAGPQG